MKFLIKIWKIVSFPLILGGLALTWYGVRNLPMVTSDKVVSVRELFSTRPDVVKLKDSLRFDLRRASLRQENFMGIKSSALAVFPAWYGSDSGSTKLVVISSRPEFVGPAVRSFKHVDSTEGAVQVHSTGTTSVGNLAPKFDALVQTLAAELSLHINDTAQGRFLARGTAIRKSDASELGIDSVAAEYWEVRLEGVPSRGRVLGSLALGVALALIGLMLQLTVKKFENQEAEQDEEDRATEAPLV
jgi:hypothetical protein